MATASPQWDIGEIPCPRCEYILDEVTAVDPDDPLKYPEPTDVTVCARCGLIIVYVDSGDGKTLTARAPYDAELAWFFSTDLFCNAIYVFHYEFKFSEAYIDAYGTEWQHAGPVMG